MDITFGSRLNEARSMRKLSQQELALKINSMLGTELKRNTISNYETGVSFPSIEILRAIVQVLKVPSDYLLDCVISTEGTDQELGSGNSEMNLEGIYTNVISIIELIEKTISVEDSIDKYLEDVLQSVKKVRSLENGRDKILAIRGLTNRLNKDFFYLFNEYFLLVTYPKRKKFFKFTPPASV